MAERTVTVKYYEGSLPRWKGYEDLDVEGEKLRVAFVKDGAGKDLLAKDVPLKFALRLHKSEAYDIIGADGKVPAEFAENASPLSSPRPKAAPVEVNEVLALRQQIAELSKLLQEKTDDLEQAGRDFNDLEAKYNALVELHKEPLGPPDKQQRKK